MVYLRNVVSLELDETACTGCGRCVGVCPHAVLVMESGHSRIGNRDACMECGACTRNCPDGAIQVVAGAGCATGVLRMLLGRKVPACQRFRQVRHKDGAAEAICEARRIPRCRGGGRPHE